ncbi:hypothetical protein MUN89_02710 [Halobacillus salinarum]|uniref:Uncharacterized protein n=1 Tax=Halobacillus salinarum TaxID=2932257 RepID=A0ABY4ELZ0_9BACI|nr:hypothetical protein [Halobacillus salinarum]UOQ44883.1 hypothetical protein MUN89_02710 [Halobacillus salinarum]
MSNGFQFNIRTQFSFTVDDETLSCILAGIAAEQPESVNITGFLQTKIFSTEKKNHKHHNPKTSCNVVRLVPGQADFETIEDINRVEDVLNTLGVKFQKKAVIQISDIEPGVPGVINAIFGALFCNVTVEAIYAAENTRLILDVKTSDLTEALAILNQPSPIPQCPKNCRPGTGKNCDPCDACDWSKEK